MRNSAFVPTRRRTAPTLANLVDTVFNDFANLNQEALNRTPKFNIKESKDQFVVELAAPGLKKEDFNISLKANQLLVAVNNEEETVEGEQFLRKTFNYNSFKKSFHLSKKVDKEGIDAVYEAGILSITLKKVAEVIPTEKKIEIK